MTTRLRLRCDGCDAETHTWVWSDPYTACTYCSQCWATIHGAESVSPPPQELSQMQGDDLTICDWRSGVDGERLWDCEECKKTIPKGGEVHFISDGGYEPRDGTYIGQCCLSKFLGPARDQQDGGT